MVELLLEHGADHDRPSLCLHTPLVESLSASTSGCFEILIKAGAVVNTGSPVTPLSVAARKGLADYIERLLNNDADPDQPDEDGKLPIEIAASEGKAECVEILLPKTKPLEKFANRSIAQMVQQEIDARLREECRVREERKAIGDGNLAYWDTNYARALECYTRALKLGHDDAALYAKMSLCYLNSDDEPRFSEYAIYYMSKKRDSSLPLSEENAKQLVVDYGKEWKARKLALALEAT